VDETGRRAERILHETTQWAPSQHPGESELVPDVEKIKQNAVRSLVYARAAGVIDLLAEQVQVQIPRTQVFTRDELVEMLRVTSERMREEV
jgi:hypothetical protein